MWEPLRTGYNRQDLHRNSLGALPHVASALLPHKSEPTPGRLRHRMPPPDEEPQQEADSPTAEGPGLGKQMSSDSMPVPELRGTREPSRLAQTVCSAGSVPVELAQPSLDIPDGAASSKSFSAAFPRRTEHGTDLGISLSKRLSKLLSTTVNFRDVQFVTREVHTPPPVQDQAGRVVDGSGGEYSTLCTGVQKNKLIIIMVGLPARGKTFLCNKLMRYLNWIGHETRHFNVGAYRRKQKSTASVQDAQFFDHHNEAGMEARERALTAALDDMLAWLEQENSQCAILDATNSTASRRQYLRDRFHGKWQYLLIETVCQDEEVLQQNYLNKMKYSPDYTGMDMKQALSDFRARIRKYEEVYETVEDRSFHYIRLTDMVTGRGHMDVNRISGYIPGKIVFFLMQVCKSGQRPRKIWLSRHGQSEYNRLERLGGDSSISEDGEKYAALLPAALLSRLPQDEQVSLSVWTSTLRRTIQTARHLPFPKLQWKALDEINAGVCDGMTYEEIAVKMPDEYKARKRDKLRYRYPEGESYLDLTQRLEPVITEIERERECVCVVSHQAVLRVVYSYFMGVPLEETPSIPIPLHTLIELTPMPDGTMHVARFPVDITRGPEQFGHAASELAAEAAAVCNGEPLNVVSVPTPPHPLPEPMVAPGSPDSVESEDSTLPMSVTELVGPALLVAGL